MVMYTENYLNNPKLKRAGIAMSFTKSQIAEYLKCANDFEYFCERYIKIVHPDQGLIPFKLRDYQKNMAKNFAANRFVICKLPRQYGKTTLVAAYIMWLVLFNDYYNIGILAHIADRAREIISIIQLAYENIPRWMQQGVIEWNKGNVELENGSKISAHATSASAARGESFNLIYLDEFAFVHNNIAEEFFTSAFPTISSGKTTKMIITSTPRGMNYFYKIWDAAERKKNNFVRVDAHWTDIPGRDEAWKEEMIRDLGSIEKFNQEFGTEFLGSSNTLIPGSKLAEIQSQIIQPIKTINNLRIYENPVEGASYVCTVDTGFGTSANYSVTTVFRVDIFPYEVVALYRNNRINTLLYPHIVHDIAKTYNMASILVEVNSVGKEISDILHFDIEYDNILTTQTRGRAGVVLGGTYNGHNNNMKFGLEMNKRTKSIGCSNLRSLIESDKLKINDQDFLAELTNFVRYDNGTYRAAEGENDDIVMTGVMFAWLTTEDYFKDLVDSNLIKKIFDDNQEALEAELLPFGAISDGISEADATSFIDKDGEEWVVSNWGMDY